MQKLSIVLMLACMVLTAACSRRYESQVNVADLNFLVRAERYPLEKGDNQMAVIIIGPGRRTVTDAKVDARFYLPTVSGTSTIESKAKASLQGDKYFITVDPVIAGVWKLDVTVTQPEKRPVTATFTIETR